jgi:hypothetical protein
MSYSSDVRDHTIGPSNDEVNDVLNRGSGKNALAALLARDIMV